mmetsp:Transcript_24700/g.68888  ORF Transcript_24700/g.68888 Transcript_24700/m.68888 type:complete len:209 (-) Transcript_24700:1299-1925(-)
MTRVSSLYPARPGPVTKGEPHRRLDTLAYAAPSRSALAPALVAGERTKVVEREPPLAPWVDATDLAVDLLGVEDPGQDPAEVGAADVSIPVHVEGLKGPLQMLVRVVPGLWRGGGKPLRIRDVARLRRIDHREERLGVVAQHVELLAPDNVCKLIARERAQSTPIGGHENGPEFLHVMVMERCEGDHAVHDGPLQLRPAREPADSGDA